MKKPRIESPYREVGVFILAEGGYRYRCYQVVELVRDAFCGSDRVDVTEASQSMVLMQLKALKHPDPYIRHIIRDLASSVCIEA